MRARTVYTARELAELLGRPTVTVPEGAACWGVGPTAFREALRTGELDLPVITVGSRRVIPTAAIRRALGMEGPQVRPDHAATGAQ